MKYSGLLKFVLIGLLNLPAATAQTRAYAKFGPDGETIALFNLLKVSSGCGSWRTFTGTITGVRIRTREREAVYRFTLRTNSTHMAFSFALEKDEIPTRDVEGLVTKTGTVKVRACRDGDRGWSVEEIARVLN